MSNLIESPSPAEPATIRDIVLRDGSTLALRPGRADDADALLRFFDGLSPRSRYQRFLGFPVLDAERARRLLAADAPEAMALVGEVSGRMVAFAGFYRANVQSDCAEVAFAIADALQGRGIGTRMLEQLSEIARRRGIRSFEAAVLADNRRMLEVFTDCGFLVTSRVDGGVVQVTIGLEPTANFVARSAARAQHAATASMKAFFQPASVAVIGANRTRGKIGSEILHNLVASGFTGSIIPVHPSAAEIEGLRAWPRVTDIPQAIDLAVVAVPAAQVLAAVDDCLAKGVRGICVISAGFGESGPEGREREAALLARIRGAGCRLIGPNCMGLLNTDPAYSLNATFAPIYPPAGSVAMSTQSGALGLAILDYARRLNIGISSFVSVGNKTDVSSNDLIQYLVGGSQHVGHPAVPRELRQPAQVQRDRPPRGQNQADRRGQGWPVRVGGAGGVLAYRGAGRQRQGRGRAFRAGRRHPHRDARGDVRRGGAPRASAHPERQARRDPDQRRRSRDSGRRRVRGRRSRAAGAERSDARRVAIASSRPRRA